MFILNPLFGFKSSQAIAYPITSLDAVGAAMSLVLKFIADNVITPNDIAIFTAMGMCWSGYLSTHVGMMDTLGVRNLTAKQFYLILLVVLLLVFQLTIYLF